MTKKIVEAVGATWAQWPVSRRKRHPSLEALHYVLATINAAQTLEGAGAFDTVDVERLFSTIDMLAKRRSHEASPFVTWDPAIEQLDVKSTSRLDANAIQKAIATSLAGRISDLATPLAEFVDTRIRGGDGKLFRSIQSEMLVALGGIVTAVKDPSYLNIILASGHWRSDVLTVATLNYDRTIEILSEQLNLPCEVGITSWSQTGHIQRPSSGIFLLKLHGSIDWAYDSTPTSTSVMENKGLKILDEPNAFSRDPAIIFGEGNKLTAEGPFLELLAAFQGELERADRLVIVGYSFRDDHINESLRRWINGQASRQVVVVDPEFSSQLDFYNPERPFSLQLALGLLGPDRAMMSGGKVDASDPGGRLWVIEKPASEGLAKWATHANDRSP